MTTPLPIAFGPQIVAAARRHHLDPGLLAAVAAQETGGPERDAGRNVVGDGGHGRGLFQIDDRWHTFARTPAAMDPAANADYAAGLLEGSLRRYGGDVHRALSAYNAGDPDARGTTTRWPDGRVLGYADSVLRHAGRIEGAAGASAPDRDAEVAGLPDVTARTGALRRAALAPAPALPALPAPAAHREPPPEPSHDTLLAADDGDPYAATRPA